MHWFTKHLTLKHVISITFLLYKPLIHIQLLTKTFILRKWKPFLFSNSYICMSTSSLLPREYLKCIFIKCKQFYFSFFLFTKINSITCMSDFKIWGSYLLLLVFRAIVWTANIFYKVAVSRNLKFNNKFSTLSNN